MGDIKILHTADLHLASSFKGLPPQIGQLRRRDLMQTLARLTDICRHKQTDLLLITGDLWEQENITRPIVDYVADQFRKIPATTVLIAPGQADSKCEGSFYSHYPWPENVHIFPRKMSSLTFPHLKLRVYGMAWEATAATSPDWNQLAAAASDDSRILIVAYGNPESLTIPQWLINLNNLAYIALGGAHRHTVWGERAWDPGCPEPLDFSCSGIYGVLTGTIGSTVALEFMPTSSRQFHKLEINVNHCSNLEEVGGEIEKELAQMDPHRDLFELRLTGTRPQGEWDLSQLQQKLKALYVAIRDETETYYDVKALETEHSRGVLGKYITAVQGADCDEKIIKQALALGLDALLSGRVAPW